MNVVIMAGGGGTRLWPLSRTSQPKQFIDLGSGKTLIDLSFNRAKNLVPIENIYVATLEDYRGRIKELLPAIPSSNIFFEPAKRDTTAAFASIAIRLKVKGEGDVPTIFLWSDHIFTAEEKFKRDLAAIPKILADKPDYVAMVGHIPISPVTVLGYIEAGEPVENISNAFYVKKFKEKPDKKTAEEFLSAGNFYWNMGYFSFRPNYLLHELVTYEPKLKVSLAKFEQALLNQDEASAEKIYKDLPAKAIEYTFIEKTPRVIVITGDYGWSDVGNWKAVKEMFGLDGDFVPHGHHVHIDSENNYVYNTTDQVVSLVGLKNMIVVITKDATLVTDEDNSHKVKEVVAKLQAAGQHKYL